MVSVVVVAAKAAATKVAAPKAVWVASREATRNRLCSRQRSHKCGGKYRRKMYRYGPIAYHRSLQYLTEGRVLPRRLGSK